MSSSLSSRASLPATSALVMADSTIRSVEERSSSRALIEVVRSLRSRSLRALISGSPPSLRAVAWVSRALWQPCADDPRRLPRALAGRRRRRRRRARGVRRVGVAGLHAALRDDAGAAGRRPAAARPAPQRHPHDARASRASRSGCGRWPTSSPTWSSTPATTWPTSTRCRRCSTRSARCSTCRASSCSAPTTTSRRSCATRCATSCPTTAARNTHTAKLPWQELKDAYADAGWLDLTNRRVSSTVGDLTVAWAGRRRPAPGVRRPASRSAGRPTPTADLRIGVAHAPYLRVLDQFAADGYEAIFAGHTHGGQVCLPLIGRAGHQLRPRAGPGQGPAPAPGRLAPGRPGVVLAARVGRARHLAVRAVPGRLPPRGDPADPDARRD